MITVVCGKSSMRVVDWRYCHDALNMCSGITFASLHNSLASALGVSSELTPTLYVICHHSQCWCPIYTSEPSSWSAMAAMCRSASVPRICCISSVCSPSGDSEIRQFWGTRCGSPSGSDLGSVSGCFANFPLLHCTICGWFAISVLCLRSFHKFTDSVHALFVVSHCLAPEQRTSTFLF